jgi:hypothetical protein
MNQSDPVLNLQAIATRLLGLDGPVLAPLAGEGPFSGSPADLLSHVARVRDAARTVEAELHVTLATDAGATAWVAGRMRHSKPTSTTLTITGASDRLAIGTELAWDGGATVSVRPFGLPIAMKVAADDPKLKDKRGWTFAETSIGRLYDTLLHPEATVTPLGMAFLDGRDLALLEVISPLRLSPATREVYGIAIDAGVPVHREMWVGDRLIYRLSLSHLRLELGA